MMLTVLKDYFGFCDNALSWFGKYLWPRYFTVCIEDKYSHPRKLRFSVPTCYCALIDKEIPDTMVINGFAYDHSIRKTSKQVTKLVN